jgi:sterol desaturase/sphingolipid hydroxylase (fatty acid hydroxylase superfamily)
MIVPEAYAELGRVWIATCAVDLGRYAIAAGLAFWLFWVVGRERFRPRLIQGSYPATRKLLHDIGWSLSSVLVFSLFGVALYYGRRAGVFRDYREIAEHGWGWFAASVVLLVVLQDAYFYWTHRAMHTRLLYRWVHRVHHRSTNPSPWTAYAFSPLEAAVHASFVPLAWWLLPLHQAAVLVFLGYMIVINVLGHLSIELLPPGFARGRLTRWHTTTTHHNLHHRYFTSNFGLYSTFWDRLMGTLHPAYEQSFERVASRAPGSDPAMALPAALSPGQLRKSG